MTKLEDAALAALLVAEEWMKQTIKTCGSENATTFLPRGYPESLKTIRRCIKLMRRELY